MRKKERLRKQHDLQKLISQAEHNTERWAGWGVGLSTAFVSSSSLIAESLVLARRALLAPRRPRAWAHPANSGYLSLLPSPHLSPSPPFSFPPPPHTHVQGEATAVFKSYDKSSGVSLRTSKVGVPAGLPCWLWEQPLCTAVPFHAHAHRRADEDTDDAWPEES